MKRTNFINKKISEQSGITLIALVLTIIILLILAGVAIATLTGDNGLLTKAGEARNTTIEAEGLEKIKLAVIASHDENGINTTSLAKNLSEINGLTDTNNQVITEITLPKSVKLNNIKYKIKEDGTVIISNPRIPDEYQEVEYIESTGTQYIDMGVIGKNSVKVFISFANNNITSGTFIFGSRKAFLQNAVVLSKHNDGGNSNCTRFAYGTEYYDLLDSFNLIDTREKNNYFFDNTHIEINNNSIYQFNNIQNFSNNLNMYLFTCNDDGIAHLKRASIYLYECKIYDDKDLVRNFIPCYTTTTVTNVDGNQVPANTKGLYDLVEGKFYTNQGTGTFGYETEDGTYVEPSPTNN